VGTRHVHVTEISAVGFVDVVVAFRERGVGGAYGRLEEGGGSVARGRKFMSRELIGLLVTMVLDLLGS
jgi:hypothetical protein